MLRKIVFLYLTLFPILSFSQHSESHKSSDTGLTTKKDSHHIMAAADCGEMMVWDRTSLSCIAYPMADMPMGMWMVHGNAFAVQNWSEGPRGRNRFASPNMLMTDIGQSFGHHYFNLDLMLTAERWTFPQDGNPLLLQIGEHDEDGKPYIDGQHPHSSPIMGLTFSDLISLGEGKDYIKIFFAPRGQATDGPVAFMHRPTGMVNPDAPLGHHTAQDVSHITSTVLGASLALGKYQLEFSGFNGNEPEPTKIDLPLGSINSSAVRIGYEFTDSVLAMISAAGVSASEMNSNKTMTFQRYSVSIYTNNKFGEDWMFHNALIYGQLNNHENIPALKSIGEEFLFFQKDLPHQCWGRIEMVERTAMQLGALGIMPLSDLEKPHWVTALSGGYTYRILSSDNTETSIGGSLTKDILPTDFKTAYGNDPLTAKIFLRFTGMKMGEF
ncbi:MAG: hypothetical protein H7235_04470 [Bdellovibrionaceae bacterium]|nr:hypothetical protein [Pseudobdellovibrionaceae bacterium]